MGLALKVLKPGSSPERSDREVDAMRRCSHPNIGALIALAEFDHGGQKYTLIAAITFTTELQRVPSRRPSSWKTRKAIASLTCLRTDLRDRVKKRTS